tara:strand:- start:1911 stop:2165 length:255 start_codon:yes stop_codon:yes gene_type:complete
VVVEVFAAVAGASIGVAGLGIVRANGQNQTSRDSLVRLTSAVDNLATRMDLLHTDMMARDREVFGRLSDLERAVARLEGHSDRN